MRLETCGSDRSGGACEGYPAERSRVDAAFGHARAVAAAPHPPADARAAAAELTDALGHATAVLDRALRVTRGRPECTAERVRLRELGVWLRRTTLDELGVVVPTTVRVGSYAASGPRIAGMVAAPADPRPARLIGVDLPAIVDGYRKER